MKTVDNYFKAVHAEFNRLHRVGKNELESKV